MNCKEFEKKIPDFMENRMDYNTLKAFYQHAMTCEECKEELTIQFLVTEGMLRLEEDGAFDLQKELEQRMEQTRKRLKLFGGILRLSTVVEILAVLLIIGAVVWLIV